jgi:hypothetical protein
LSIAGGASVVGEDTSGIMTGWCCTTVGGGGLEEVHFGLECLTFFDKSGGDEGISGGGR